MKNLRVTLAALVVWTAVSTALVLLLPLERAMPFLLLGLCLVPVAVFLADWLRSSPRAGRYTAGPREAPPTAGPAPAVPEDALTEENLRRVFGANGVATAWAPKLSASPASVDTLERLGGPPAFLAPVVWPRCRRCGTPLTFIMQVAVGPERPLRYPEEGLLYVFLCQRVDVRTREDAICPCFDVDQGAERCFVQPRPAGTLTLTVEPIGSRLAKSYAVEGWQARPSVRMPAGVATPEQYSLYAAMSGWLDIQVGGFADWVQDEANPGPCSCGAPRELVLQFAEFEDDLNLGGAGRAYVFACSARHAPDAFSLFWQTA
ncbi:DUF1963 domain-containing protein [Pyxidicoccus trucidator]|uniref:DUF1963 domain-containing protein n=1 Tax=Pyxidicoccus trucidator TaxID=2709662 RepID=UPI0013D9042A|nr:DUF1963 domain-containing protein [Pyxidicoccus trucidator]